MNSASRGARQPRRAWRRVDGVLLLDKGQGMSSNHALQAARRLFNAEKAGHTGTLDPMATGLLPLCFGEATKFAGELLNADKRYVARLRLGITTDTADAEGRVLEQRPVAVSPARIESVLAGFVGEISQVPPMYSALKRDGKPLYEYARAGVELEREPRQVTIFALRLLAWNEPDLEFEVRCSKGTYVRTLGADLAEQLGCGGHLTALRRTGIGGLDIADAFSIEQLRDLADEARDAALAAPDSLLGDLESAILNHDQTRRMCHGQPVIWPGAEGRRLRLYGPAGQFIGVARTTAESLLVAQRLVATS